LYLVDITETCGYSVKQQVALFKSLRPLFVNKPVLIVCTKIDMMKLDALNEEDKQLVLSLATDGAEIVTMSNISEEGVSAVKTVACDKLLAQRVEVKMKALAPAAGGSSVMNRLHMAVPAPRDDKQRPPVIPETVAKAKETEMEHGIKERVKERDPEDDKPLWLRNFGSNDWKKAYDLKTDEWNTDIIPEIVDGKNIADYVDPEILRRLEELEQEEEEREEAAANQKDEMDEDLELDDEDMQKVKEIRERKRMIVKAHRMGKNTQKNNPILPGRHTREADIDTFASHLADLGIDPSKAADRMRSRSASRSGRKRSRSESTGGDAAELKKVRAASRSRSLSRGDGLKDLKQKEKVDKLAKLKQKDRNKAAKKGEADRVILNMKPKHLFSGKRGAGKTDRR